MVLLKNESLPAAAFGCSYGAVWKRGKKTVKGGIGLRDVNNRKTISVYQGLLEAGAMITSEAVAVRL